jgi:hypothetical protein
MSIPRCPHCSLPMTESEAASGKCPACAKSLRVAAEPAVKPPKLPKPKAAKRLALPKLTLPKLRLRRHASAPPTAPAQSAPQAAAPSPQPVMHAPAPILVPLHKTTKPAAPAPAPAAPPFVPLQRPPKAKRGKHLQKRARRPLPEFVPVNVEPPQEAAPKKPAPPLTVGAALWAVAAVLALFLGGMWLLTAVTSGYAARSEITVSHQK